jgi:hypothetical protein
MTSCAPRSPGAARLAPGATWPRETYTIDLGGDIGGRPQLAEAVFGGGDKTIVTPFAICDASEGGTMFGLCAKAQSAAACAGRPNHTASDCGHELKGN